MKTLFSVTLDMVMLLIIGSSEILNSYYFNKNAAKILQYWNRFNANL